MLYLDAPFFIIEGVAVLPDHADKLQFYYMPLAPRLTTHVDAVTGATVPHLQFIKYSGSAGNGGFLEFDVNLGIDEDVLDTVRRKLHSQLHLSDTPRLAPIPLADGTVKLLVFGYESGATPTSAAGPQFVLKLSHHAKPSLYGDNQAAFSVHLDEAGAVLMDKALQGELAPVAVIYDLKYLALRPAYSVRLTIDWDRVQKHMDERFSPSDFVSSVDIEKVVDELKTKGYILLEGDTYVPEGEKQDEVLGRRDRALEEVRDLITDTFFTPSVPPIPPASERNKTMETVDRVASLLCTGGWAGVTSFNYSKTEIAQIDRKRLNVEMRERTTVLRTIAPQGHLTGLFSVLRQPGIDRSRFVIEANLDHPFFRRRRVEVISRGDFVGDSISSIDVRLEYSGQPKNVVLDSPGQRKSFDWASLLDNGAMEWDVEASYVVNFQAVDNTERPISLTSPPFRCRLESLEIQPRELYALRTIPVYALGYPWDIYPNVEVQCRYDDEAHGIHVRDSFLLDAKNTSNQWKVFVQDPQLTRFQYRLLHRAADHQDIKSAWIDEDGDQIVVRDPYPRKLTVDVVPIVRWTEVERVFVDLTYEDADNGVFKTQSFGFTKDHADTERFSVGLVDTRHHRVQYRVTLLYFDGRMKEIPPSTTLQARILVREDMKGHRIVTIRPKATDFEQWHVREIQVDMRYEDGGGNLSYADQFKFTSSADSATFEFDYLDEAKNTYEWQATWFYTNGMSRSTDWQSSAAAVLVVPVE